MDLFYFLQKKRIFPFRYCRRLFFRLKDIVFMTLLMSSNRLMRFTACQVQFIALLQRSP